MDKDFTYYRYMRSSSGYLAYYKVPKNRTYLLVRGGLDSDWTKSTLNKDVKPVLDEVIPEWERLSNLEVLLRGIK